MGMLERRIEALNPRFQPIATGWLKAVNTILYPTIRPTAQARIAETLRTEARQGELLAGGDSDVKRGWHNFGLAFDFVVLDNGVYQKDDRLGLYTAAGLLATAFGCRWPITIKSGKDYGHIEYHPGFTFAQYLAAREKGVCPLT